MSPIYGTISFADVVNGKDYSAIGRDGRRSLVLDGLGSINILVGSNNAGKSRFLRSILNAEDLKFWPHGFGAQEYNSAIQSVVDSFQKEFGTGGEKFSVSQGDLTPFLNQPWFLSKGNVRILRDRAQKLHQGIRASPFQDSRLAIDTDNLLKLLEKTTDSLGNESRVYVPVLRGLRPFPQGSANCYEERTREDYKIVSDKTSVPTGLKMYQTLHDKLFGAPEERDLMERFQAFLSEELFDKQEVVLIPRTGSDVVFARIGNDSELPIHQLGDGIQNIVIITFAAFVEEKASLFFIEEPETHLHPGMQRKLLELFLRDPILGRHQVFLTTHSNHLLDMAADYNGCTTFLFRKRSQDSRSSFTITTMTSADRAVLEELGVRASSVFLTNATIWVEGISDRRYLREYLRKYFSKHGIKEFKEDTHYSFMEAGGANIVHFDFEASGSSAEVIAKIKVARICTNCFVVLDGDNFGKARVQELKDALGEDFFMLQSKEVEHLLPVEILRRYVVSKAESAVNSNLLTLNDYHKVMEPLGRILDSKLKVDKFAEGQTIKNKDSLCEFCIDYMREHPDDWSLTPEAEQVCEKIVCFVKRANGG